MSLGASLRAAREAAGMSVEDVSRATRIRSQLVREIEADDFHGCGGTVYARGHIRSISTAVGADAVPLVAEFDLAQGGVPDGPGVREVFEREVLAIPDRKGPNWTVAMAVAAAVALVVAVVSVVNNGAARPSEVAGPDAGLGTPTVSSSPAVAPTQASPAPSELTAGLIDPGKVHLRVTLVGDKSWVVVRDGGQDGRTIFQKTLLKGATMDFVGERELYIVLGNAGAVSLVVNGRDLGAPGQLGQVLRTSFFPGDPAAG